MERSTSILHVRGRVRKSLRQRRQRRGPLVLTANGQARPYHPDKLPDGRPVLRKIVHPEHELLTPPGVAVDEAVLAEAERGGFEGVVVERTRTGAVLWAPLSRWRSGIPIRRGFGPQRGLLWRELVPLDQAPTMPHRPVAKAAVTQVELFAALT